MLAGNTAFADEWTKQDTHREAAYLVLHLLDFAQTRNIARNPDTWHEQNTLLGLHPTTAQVNRYFILTGIAHVSIAPLLSYKWRRDFQTFTIGIEFGAVSNNFSIGIAADF